jgi:hypothetical protein
MMTRITITLLENEKDALKKGVQNIWRSHWMKMMKIKDECWQEN